MTSVKKVLEFHPNEKISLPIVKFPPFKLRAALVEKDPVVWAHLLETYITYLQYLLADARLDKLDEVTSDQLIIFVRTYLHEMAEEEGKLLSLGMNLEVTNHLTELRGWIFVLIRSCGLLHLQIFSETLWDLVKLYVNEFPDTVRGLINGKLQPSINTQKANLNKIYQVQQQVRHLLEGGIFSRVDLKALEVLLSRDKGKKETGFADEFLTREWSELLETLYLRNPQSTLEEWCKKLAILSFLCASEDRLVSLLEELGISKPDALGRYPLIGSLLLSNGFKKRFPGLSSRISFLRLLEHADDTETLTANSNLSVLFTNEEKAAVTDLFPAITDQQLTLLFSEYGSLDVVIDVLLDDPSMLERMPTSAAVVNDSADKHITSMQRKELKNSDRIQRNIDNNLSHVPDEVRNKTLNRALQLLYSNYEDERDDTYDEADVAKPTPERIDVDADPSKEQATYDEVEAYLWDMLKKDKPLFERRQRGTSVRKELKRVTSWSDEQIEGWARMLERSPQRAQLLEEKFMFRGNVRTGKTSYVKNKDTAANPTANKGTMSTVFSVRDPKQVSRGKSKSTRGANHNRKAGHTKKLNRATGA